MGDKSSAKRGIPVTHISSPLIVTRNRHAVVSLARGCRAAGVGAA